MEVITILLSAFVAALATTIIANLNQRYLSRPQGVGTNIDSFPVLSKPIIGEISVKIVITYQSSVHEYEDLHNATIEIENLTSKDYDEFKFGVDFTNGDRAVYVAVNGKDKLHEISPVDAPEFSNPLEKMIFVCKPFYRRDKYTVNALVTVPKGNRSTSGIDLLFDNRFKNICQGTYGN